MEMKMTSYYSHIVVIDKLRLWHWINKKYKYFAPPPPPQKKKNQTNKLQLYFYVGTENIYFT